MAEPDDDFDPWGLEAIEKRNAQAGEDAPALSIETIEGVEPLGDQFGIWPTKTSPEALREPLFGQPEPTDAEIAHYGSADVVPPMKTYGILDAAKVFGMVAILERSQVRYQCLFKGAAAEDYRDVAPYLVELEEDNDFTKILFTYLPDQPKEMTTIHLWHKKPGIYIRSRATFNDIWRHFRKFTKIRMPNGKVSYFRFWEPELLMCFLQVSTEAELGKFFFLPSDIFWAMKYSEFNKTVSFQGSKRAVR